MIWRFNKEHIQENVVRFLQNFTKSPYFHRAHRFQFPFLSIIETLYIHMYIWFYDSLKVRRKNYRGMFENIYLKSIKCNKL